LTMQRQSKKPLLLSDHPPIRVITDEDWGRELRRARSQPNRIRDRIKERLPMKVIVAGSRRLNTQEYPVYIVADALFRSGWVGRISEIVSGGARGIDLAGEAWAESYQIPIKRFLPDWDKYGKAAGHIRNGEMANYADALCLVWDGKSKGSANMKKQAESKGLKIYEYIV
jgi:hypothetical protein